MLAFWIAAAHARAAVDDEALQALAGQVVALIVEPEDLLELGPDAVGVEVPRDVAVNHGIEERDLHVLVDGQEVEDLVQD